MDYGPIVKHKQHGVAFQSNTVEGMNSRAQKLWMLSSTVSGNANLSSL
jgi:hypothetical protein